jgi:hypothetical protein
VTKLSASAVVPESIWPRLSVRSTDRVLVVSGSAWLGKEAASKPWRAPA